MPQDAFTLRYLCEELNLIFSGGKINRIIQPDNDRVVFTVFTGSKTCKLLLNVNPSSPRIGVVENEGESPLVAPNFCMLLRKHLLGARIEEISLVGFDRIVKIRLTAEKEFSNAIEKTLFVELMGRYSNIILTESGRVLGGNRGINMFDAGIRPLIVGRPYVFPPVQNKKEPLDKSLVVDFTGALDEQELVLRITQSVQGIALSTAKDVARKFFSKNQTIDKECVAQKFYDFLVDYLYNRHKNPCLVYENGVVKDVLAFPYDSVLGEIKYFDNLYQAEQEYYLKKEELSKYNLKSERLKSITNTAIKKVKKRLNAIKSKEKDALSAEQNRLKGELLLANIYRIKNGEKQVELNNYYDNTTMIVELDENLSVSKNAENYYKKYNKQKRTLTALLPQKEMAESELDYLNSVLEEIEICENLTELNHVQTELENAGLIKTNVKVKENKNVNLFRQYLIGGFKVFAGRNNTENDKLTFGVAKPNDIWLHAKEYHSTHVIIQSEGREVPLEVLSISAKITAYYSKARNGGKTEVVYTKKHNVKKQHKAKPGQVIYDNFKSIIVNGEKCAEFLIN